MLVLLPSDQAVNLASGRKALSILVNLARPLLWGGLAGQGLSKHKGFVDIQYPQRLQKRMFRNVIIVCELYAFSQIHCSHPVQKH